MSNEQRRRIELLCRQIETERDQNVFAQLVRELNLLLESRDARSNGFSAKANGNGHGAIYNPYLVFARNPQVQQLLARMIDATDADYGNVQLLDSSRSGLRIVAHQGFGDEFLSYFETVCRGSYSCGAAMNQQSRVVVNDILTDPLFRDPQTRGVMLRANVRACQSAPLLDPIGNFIGVVSTHFQQPRDFDPALWMRTDRLVADFTKGLPQSNAPQA